MAGTITAVETRHRTVTEIIFSWLSHTDGVATATATTYPYSGEIIKVVCIPGATTPSDLYDVTLSDADSIDLLAGQGVDCPNGSSLVITGGMIPVVESTISLTIAGGGSAKNGTVHVYLR